MKRSNDETRVSRGVARAGIAVALAATALALCPTPAAARVELPKKALVTWVFSNSAAYVDGCAYPYGAFSPAEALYNAQTLIAQGVAAGVRGYFIDTFNNAKSPLVTGIYAEAARAWNAAHPKQRVCVAPLVESNNAAYVVGQFKLADAPSAAASAFCTHNGHPVIASWSPTPTYAWGTAIPKAIKDAGLGTIAFWPYFHYLNAGVYSGMRAYLPAYKSAGAAEVGVLQFGSGDSASDSAMLSLKPAADADGVLLVPAIAMSRAVSCGDSACHGSRGSSYFVDMKGFEVLLRQWQRCVGGYDKVGTAKIQYCNMGLGFAGDLGEDAYHDPAQYCDPWDTMNKALGRCASVPDYKRAARPTNFGRSWRVNKWTHRGFYRVDQDYAQLFLTGKQPALKQEYVAFAYRQHPLKMPAPAGDLCAKEAVTVRLPQSQGKTFWGDRVYVTSNLASPAALRVTFGGKTDVLQLTAGMIWSTDPKKRQDGAVVYSAARVGRPHFELSRGGAVIASWDGALTITMKPRQDATTVTRNTGTYADYHAIGGGGPAADGGAPDGGAFDAALDAGSAESGAAEAGVEDGVEAGAEAGAANDAALPGDSGGLGGADGARGASDDGCSCALACPTAGTRGALALLLLLLLGLGGARIARGARVRRTRGRCVEPAQGASMAQSGATGRQQAGG